MGRFPYIAMILLMVPGFILASFSSSVYANEIDNNDYSGVYYTALGHSQNSVMNFDINGGSVFFTLETIEVSISGSGALNGDTMTLTAEVFGTSLFSGKITFYDNGERFIGNWQITGEQLIKGTLAGRRSPFPTYDVDAAGVPRLATANCVDLDKIAWISMFRSGFGHDYSDAFEECRSMKHYFEPKEGVDFSTIRFFSPVSGTVVGLTEEWEGTTLYKGTVVGIRPDGYDAFCVALFHLDLSTTLAVGDRVTAGQELGTSEKISGTAGEIAVEVLTPSGMKLVSFFDAMDDSVFAVYQARGVPNREAVIISKAERDADPMTCDGETFTSTSVIENLFPLSSIPQPHLDTRLSDGLITVNVSLDPLKNGGKDADWFLLASSPFGYFSYSFEGWLAGIIPAYTGPLFSLPQFTVLQSPIPFGNYNFCFGIDLKANGSLDTEEDILFYDCQHVTVP